MRQLLDALQPERPLFDASRDNRLICCKVTIETSDAKSYVFAPMTPARLAFLPGQYMNFSFNIGDEPMERCYSIASAATNEARIAITVKRVAGGRVSNWLFDHMRVGVIVRASDPLGAFTPTAAKAPKILLLSAGSGITPVMSMLRTVEALGADTDIVFLHAARRLDDVIYRNELEHLACRLPNLRMVLHVTRPDASETSGPTPGRLDAQTLVDLVPDISGRAVFCCGPTGFMASARAYALSHGVTADAYFEEHFVATAVGEPTDGLHTATAKASFAVRFDKLNRTIDCPADMTLLKAAQQAKIPMPSSCQRGMCGTCRTKLISGTVDMRHGGGIRPRDVDKGFILPCCSRPTSDIVLEK